MQEVKNALIAFARDAEKIPIGLPDTTPFSFEKYSGLGQTSFTVGDLRQASKALTKLIVAEQAMRRLVEMDHQIGVDDWLVREDGDTTHIITRHGHYVGSHEEGQFIAALRTSLPAILAALCVPSFE